MIRVMVIGDSAGGGPAAACALEGDGDVRIVAKVADPSRAALALSERAADVIVFHQLAPDLSARVAVQRAAQESGAGLVLLHHNPNDDGSRQALCARVRAAAGERAGQRAAPARPATVAAGPGARQVRLIAIGASTGGVEALVQVIARFPANTPPTVIVQHMPQHFTASFAARLDGLCAARVAEGWDGAPLESGRIYLAPGGPAHMEVCWSPNRCVRLTPTDPVNRHRPSVDVCFDSIARAQIPGVVGVLLTGMGRDGADGLKAIRAIGGRTIAQDRETSTVYGMPKAAMENGAVETGTPLNEIVDAIFMTQRQAKEAI